MSYKQETIKTTTINHRIYPYSILIVLLFFTSYLMGQSLEQINFKKLSREDGLSSNSLHQVVQDDKDFLWCGSFNGLNRFDGINFQVFKTEKDNPNSIIGNHIRAIHWDAKGFLWVGTLKNGISRYNPKTGKFKHFQSIKEDPNTLSSNNILCFFEDSNEQLWVGTEDGLNIFNPKSETFRRFLPSAKKNSLSSSSIISIAEDERGWIWLATWAGGLNLAIPTKNKRSYTFRHFKSNLTNPSSLKSDNIWSLFKDHSNRFWVGTFNGGISLMLPNDEKDPKKFIPKFVTYRKSSVELQNNQPADNIIFAINQDQNGAIWTGTVNGLSLFYPDQHFSDLASINPNQPHTVPQVEFKHLQHNSTGLNSLPHNEVRNIFFDKNNIAWCSTVNGIGKFDPNSIRFKHFLKPAEKNGNIFISSITEYNKNTVYIGTRAKYGLIKYDVNTDKRTSYLHEPSNPNSIANDEVISSFKYNEDTLIIGTQISISIFLPKKNKFINYFVNDRNGKTIDNLNPKKILKDSNNNIWIATEKGLLHFDIKKGPLELYNKTSGLGFKKENPNLNDIIEDEYGNLWIASFEALYKFTYKNQKKPSLKAYTHDKNNPKSICSDRVVVIAKRKKEIWIGTEDGFSKYNAETDDFENLTSENGLINSSILSMEVDNNDNIWAGTREGLFLLELPSKTIRYFDAKDGLQADAFNYFSSCKNADGQLYFGGINGYNAFYGEKIKLIKNPPPVYITDIKVFNASKLFSTDKTNLDNISLSYKESFFTIEFSALNFTQAEENQYAYMLEGFDKKWIHNGTRNFASYTNLDGGTYKFRVKAANNDGFWNEAGKTLTITIVPPFWKTLWFMLLVALIVITLSVAFYKNRVNSIKQQQYILEQEVKNRTSEIANQKKEIEELVTELQFQNETLETKVAQRTKHLKYINDDLIRSNKDLEQFAYIASHDLQEPLRMVGNFVQLLELKYGNKLDQNGKEYINFAVEGVKRMSNLIKSLLNYSKVGKSDIKFSVADLNCIIKSKVDDLSLLIEERKANIKITPFPQNIVCEPEQIGIIFFNLIHNAIKFNHNENPSIQIFLKEENDNYYTFVVRDNGIGIEEGYQDRVFEIFKRLNNRSDFKGNGIGLSVCKRIVSRHKGDIWYESKENQGTTFYFTINKHLNNIDIEGESIVQDRETVLMP